MHIGDKLILIDGDDLRIEHEIYLQTSIIYTCTRAEILIDGTSYDMFCPIGYEHDEYYPIYVPTDGWGDYLEYDRGADNFILSGNVYNRYYVRHEEQMVGYENWVCATVYIDSLYPYYDRYTFDNDITGAELFYCGEIISVSSLEYYNTLMVSDSIPGYFAIMHVDLMEYGTQPCELIMGVCNDPQQVMEYVGTTPNNHESNFTWKYPVVLSSISTNGQITTFTVGDTWTFGGTVTAHYSDTSNRDVTSVASFSGYNTSVAGNQIVRVSYTEGSVTVTTQYTITVNPPTPILSSITSSGQITTFTVGDTWTFGGRVMAQYTNASDADVTTSCTFSGGNTSTTGTKTITISYTENGITKTTQYTITVNPVPLSKTCVANIGDIETISETEQVDLRAYVEDDSQRCPTYQDILDYGIDITLVDVPHFVYTSSMLVRYDDLIRSASPYPEYPSTIMLSVNVQNFPFCVNNLFISDDSYLGYPNEEEEFIQLLGQEIGDTIYYTNGGQIETNKLCLGIDCCYPDLSQTCSLYDIGSIDLSGMAQGESFYILAPETVTASYFNYSEVAVDQNLLSHDYYFDISNVYLPTQNLTNEIIDGYYSYGDPYIDSRCLHVSIFDDGLSDYTAFGFDSAGPDECSYYETDILDYRINPLKNLHDVTINTGGISMCKPYNPDETLTIPSDFGGYLFIHSSYKRNGGISQSTFFGPYNPSGMFSVAVPLQNISCEEGGVVQNTYFCPEGCFEQGDTSEDFYSNLCAFINDILPDCDTYSCLFLMPYEWYKVIGSSKSLRSEFESDGGMGFYTFYQCLLDRGWKLGIIDDGEISYR